jgi:hypothetical protein
LTFKNFNLQDRYHDNLPRFNLSGTTKLTGSAIPSSLKNRPRIPTPDVTREMIDGHRNSVILSVAPLSNSPTPLDKENLQEMAPQPETSVAPQASRLNTSTNDLPAVVQVKSD